MQYFDLNLKPVIINQWSVVDGICNLITNAIRQYENQTYFDHLQVQYDENTNTLKIIDEGSGINLLNFMGQLNAEHTNLTNGLRLAISSLLANKINITFTSSLGTFTPIVRNKDNLNEDIMSIFIAYDQKEVKPTKWFTLKSHNNLATDEIKKGTQVIISPLTVNIVKDIKDSFSFLLPWTKKIVTKAGYLLVNTNNHPNNCFLNGFNLTYFNEQANQHDKHFAYSYDLNASYFNDDLIKNNLHRIWNFLPTCINAIYENLSNEDKATIFNNLLNNHDYLEWNEPLIRKSIVQYYAHHHPEQYLLGVWQDENDAFLSFAKKENKTIIWLKDRDEYDELKDMGISTINKFGQAYATSHYSNYVNIQDLSETESNNWNNLQDFLYYFINNNEKIDSALNKNNQSSFNLKIVENLPNKEGLYLYDNEVGIIDKEALHDLTNLFPESCKVTWVSISNEIEWNEYKHLWIGTLTNFAFDKKQHDKKN